MKRPSRWSAGIALLAQLFSGGVPAPTAAQRAQAKIAAERATTQTVQQQVPSQGKAGTAPVQTQTPRDPFAPLDTPWRPRNRHERRAYAAIMRRLYKAAMRARA